MKRVVVVVAGLIVFAATSSLPLDAQAQRGWTTLFDGKNIDAFNKVGDANWTIADGVLQADKGMGGYLVTKQPYTDFEIRAEFWVDTPANSGIFIRCDNPQMPGAEACYEVNIFDTVRIRPTAQAPSSTWPRWRRRSRPGANGTPTRSARRDHT